MDRSITSILHTTKWEWHNGIVITDYSVVVSLKRKNSFMSQIAITMKLHTDTAVLSHTATEIIASRPVYSYCDPLLFTSEIIPLLMWLCGEICMCVLSVLCWNCSPSELCESKLSIFPGFNYCPSNQHGIRSLLFLIFIHPILYLSCCDLWVWPLSLYNWFSEEHANFAHISTFEVEAVTSENLHPFINHLVIFNSLRQPLRYLPFQSYGSAGC